MKNLHYEPHPLAACWSMPDNYDDIKESIRQVGQVEPITLFDGQILDGIQRYTICGELGIEPKFHSPEISDPFAYVLAKNKHRRHLTKGAVAMAVAKMAKLQRGSNQYHAKSGCVSKMYPLSIQELADNASLSRSELERAKQIHQNGVPELIEAVSTGKVGTTKARQICILPKEEQAAALNTRSAKRSPAQAQKNGYLSFKAWKKSVTYQNLVAEDLAIINARSVYPPDLGLPTNDNPKRQLEVQTRIKDLKVFEPGIAKMSQRELNEEIHPHVQFIQTYAMPPDGRLITGQIDPLWVSWAQNVAKKMQARKAILIEEYKYKDALKKAKDHQGEPNRQKKEVPIFEQQWTKYTKKLKEGLIYFHRDDVEEIARRTHDYILGYFIPKTKNPSKPD